MSIALPIQLIVGDTGSYPCLITGGTLVEAIFSFVVELSEGYSLNGSTITGPSSYSYTLENGLYAESVSGNNKILINVKVEEESSLYFNTSHNITFILPAKLTESFKSGKYTYDISVKQDADSMYTPIYSNAFNILPKINKIITISST